MFGSGFNGDVNKIKILDVLNDGELHEFRIIKVCDHTEKQRKAFKFHYDPEFNFYYRLSFVDKDNIKWFTETTFNQAITKAIFKEIEYYNKSIIEKHKADSINIDGFKYYNKNINNNEENVKHSPPFALLNEGGIIKIMIYHYFYYILLKQYLITVSLHLSTSSIYLLNASSISLIAPFKYSSSLIHITILNL